MKTMDREMVNAAIRTVLTTQFKKNCKDAHKLVESCGYEISKNCGDWEIRNNVTKRCVCLGSYIHFNPYQNGLRNRRPNIDKFDFVGCLEKPYNKDYWNDVLGYQRGESKSVRRYESLRFDRWCAGRNSEKVRETLAEIEVLQRKLIDLVRDEQTSWDRYNESRKRLGLKERRR